MAQNPLAPDFDLCADELIAHLPEEWRAADPSSNLHAVAQAVGVVFDGLSAVFEQVYLDQALPTASPAGLRRNFALAWGVAQEQLPTVLPQLRAYLQALAAYDGSAAGMVQVLTAFVNSPVNLTGGTILTFPAGGGGLIFPAGGGGLALVEFTPANVPSVLIGLQFPADGSGLQFPAFTSSVVNDSVLITDGAPIGVGAGLGLTFASNQLIQIVLNAAKSTLTVKVQSWLAFDRPSFYRAVQRMRPMDWFPPVVQEVTAFT